MDSVAAIELSAVSAFLFPRVMSRGTPVSREVRLAGSGSGAGRGRLFAGLSADARDAGGDGNFTRYDGAGASDQPFW